MNPRLKIAVKLYVRYLVWVSVMVGLGWGLTLLPGWQAGTIVVVGVLGFAGAMAWSFAKLEVDKGPCSHTGCLDVDFDLRCERPAGHMGPHRYVEIEEGA